MREGVDLIEFGFPTKEEKVAAYEAKVKYIQEADSNSPSGDMQTLNIIAEDAGGGYFFVIKTKRWAFDNIDELITILEDFKKRL